MRYLIPLILLFGFAYAADIDRMAQALRNEGLNDKATKILLRHAKLECGYNDKIGLDSVKGIASENGWNLWNATCRRSYKGKKRIAYEYEQGRLVRKYFYVWDTSEIGARQFVRFLRRRYSGALTEASKGNWQEYMRVLRNKGYFGKV